MVIKVVRDFAVKTRFIKKINKEIQTTTIFHCLEKMGLLFEITNKDEHDDND